MDLVIRTDASEQIGSGHMMRCLTLAEKVRSDGGGITFICRELPGNRCDFIESQKFNLIRLPFENNSGVIDEELEHSKWLTVSQELDAKQALAAIDTIGLKADWLLVDHYALDYKWEEKLRSCAANIMVIDDLADRKHNCDLLLDQNLHYSMNERYISLVPAGCHTLLGPEFALLRSEFEIAKNNSTRRDGSIKRVLIFMGGYDLSNETGKALDAMLSLKQKDLIIDVVVGATNKNRDKLEAIYQPHKEINIHCQIKNISELMNLADLAIGGGGTTTWERAYLGLPSIVIILAKNQAEFSEAVADYGATVCLGWYNNVTEDTIAQSVKSLMDDRQQVVQLSNKARSLFGRKEVSGVDAVINKMTLISSSSSDEIDKQSTRRIS